MTRTRLIAGLVLASLPAGAAMAATRVAGPAPLQFVCTVQGAEKLAKGFDKTQICAVFQRRFEAAGKRSLRPIGAWPRSGDAVSVTIRFAGPREASASARVRLNGKIMSVPELTQDIMDKSLGLRDLDFLATQLAATTFRR